MGPILDHISKFENLLLPDDFNSEMSEKVMIEFCNTYNFKNLTKDPTCFKNVHNPSTIDLIPTDKPRSYLNNITIESGLSDHHKLTITFSKSHTETIRILTYTYFAMNSLKNYTVYMDEKLTMIPLRVSLSDY